MVTGAPRTVAYLATVAVASAAIIAPVWVGSLPAIADFGAHAQIVDAWVTLDENPVLAAHLQRQPGWLKPNLLPARLAALLHPWLAPVISLRLFFSGAIAGVIIAYAVLLRTFGRDRWLVLFALPWLWGGMVSVGLVNYVAAVGLALAAASVARTFALRPRPAPFALLFALSMAAFFVHVIGWGLVVGMTLAVLILTAERARRFLGVLALVPSAGAVAVWLTRSLREASFDLGDEPIPGGLAKKVALFIEDFNVTAGYAPTLAFAATVALWVALIFSARGIAGSPAPTQRWTTVRTLELVAAALAVAYLALPFDVGGIAVWIRFVVPIVLLVIALPHLPRPRPAGRAIVAAQLVVVLAFGAHVGQAMHRFDTAELAPVRRLAAVLPREQRVQCAGVVEPSPPAAAVTDRFPRWPLYHNCNAIMQLATGAYVGGIEGDRVNAVVLRNPNAPPHVHESAWQDNADLAAHWDYIVVRGPHRAPAGQLLRRMRRIAPSGARTFWTLYQVVR